jgi:hypothetical protein
VFSGGNKSFMRSHSLSLISWRRSMILLSPYVFVKLCHNIAPCAKLGFQTRPSGV